MFSSTAKNIEMFFEKKIELYFLLVSYGRSNLITVEVPVPSSSASEEGTGTGTYRYYCTVLDLVPRYMYWYLLVPVLLVPLVL